MSVIRFLMTSFLKQQFLYWFTWSSNQLLNLIIFSFLSLQTFLLINSIFLFLTIESSASIHWQTDLTNLFPSFWLFLVFFRMLWMLVTVHKPCHVPHASRITTSGTIFTEKLFSVSKEWVRPWSHAFLITYDKTLTYDKAFGSLSRKIDEKEKKKKTRKAIAKHFALNLNAKNIFVSRTGMFCLIKILFLFFTQFSNLISWRSSFTVLSADVCILLANLHSANVSRATIR